MVDVRASSKMEKGCGKNSSSMLLYFEMGLKGTKTTALEFECEQPFLGELFAWRDDSGNGCKAVYTGSAIHTKRRPQKEKLSEAKTMCTLVVKAFKDIQAVPATHALCTHDQNGIDIESCIQLITAASSMHDISNSYASVMPDWLTKAFFNPELERHRLNIHQYCDSENVRMMRKMDDLHLLDFVELRLKSKGDFDTAYDVAMSTGLAAYLKKFTVFQPGDWPSQFYCRQIIYESLKKFVSSHPGFSDIPPQQEFIPSDHSSYSFPMTSGTTDNLLNNSLPQETSQPSILSIVPTIGPLHISLNSREHIVNSYHPFFKKIYETIFPRSKLADNPKPWRVSLILEIVYGGWTLIPHNVMAKFSRFKDVGRKLLTLSEDELSQKSSEASVDSEHPVIY
ncbi:hypothetical protein AWC38_SpisGene16764 [Stylophora pistillata]|uniref:Uncharacterized protein n=1 Tax=Stylophora pistillata TaxID=50429 RepID=A0A2B4RKC7_STYPI|nr:hypothetical protein AWC38_SpisGene16764 [Stylophora pistillata]